MFIELSMINLLKKWKKKLPKSKLEIHSEKELIKDLKLIKFNSILLWALSKLEKKKVQIVLLEVKDMEIKVFS